MDQDSTKGKQSSGDLISRLKTRKILGVGETDNGDIHRSKISQVLGHNEHLFVRLPKGYWVTHFLLGIEITLEAFLLLLTPAIADYFGFMPAAPNDQTNPTHAVRLAGAALSGIVVFLWALVGTTDKHYARTVLLALFVYHSLSLFLILGAAFNQGTLGERWVRFVISLRVLACLVCFVYFHSIGEPGSGVRKSSSYRDISKDEAKFNVKVTNDISPDSDDKKGK